MAEMFYAPEDTSAAKFSTVFLAGSIDMGKAVDWQAKIFKKCKDINISFLNPRRLDWDSSWKQEIENDQFREQVTWELDHLDSCDTIVLNFSKESQAPISLLEMGLHVKSGKMLICCPKGYWKKGNVDIVAKRYGIQVFDTIDEVIGVLKIIHNVQ